MLDWLYGKSGYSSAPRKSAAAMLPEMTGGLTAGTLVATAEGWRLAETISAGDKLVTFDDGVRTVTGVTRRQHALKPSPIHSVAPLLSLPEGAVGNRRALLVPEGQALVVESDLAESVLGDPFALVDASHMMRMQGARRVLPKDPVVLVTLSFEEDQMIYIEGNAVALCPADRHTTPETIEDAIWGTSQPRYKVLPKETAQMVVAGAGMEAELAKRQFRGSPSPHHA
ncbi:Hint domain-containing protein [Tropicimonas sediminicola]|uniref:Hint domain-containing protein n=1 Tax=Tropicimonas sediminicola TaxID=1031541 RepID=A0A239M9X1_9RHOB|nr:Hint domain-containing protein [Tropicimonas sediminicola]SNT38639.1 Hint domain-containing protein [Tropicimonas sediminicola]